jgi:selenocysteine lyase/cysteine desulfurase
VDGVHALGVEDASPADLGCDFLAAGTHKWLFGPRGTGIWWGRADAWGQVDPAIPPFGTHTEPGSLHTPGGFHSFEHRWAVEEAFRMHLAIGRARVRERLHALNRRIREGLSAMPHVHLHTPLPDDLAAGIACFEVNGLAPGQVVARLAEKGIVASASPYIPSYARLAAGLFNTEDEIDRALKAVRELA